MSWFGSHSDRQDVDALDKLYMNLIERQCMALNSYNHIGLTRSKIGPFSDMR